MAKGVHGHTGRNPITGSAVVTGMIFYTGTGFKKTFQSRWIKPQRLPLNIKEYRVRPAVCDSIDRCHKAQGLGNDLITRLNPSQFKGNMEGTGAVYHGYSMSCAGDFAYHFLKTIDILAYRGNKGGIDTVNNILLFITDKPWRVQRNRALVGIERFDEVDNL
jgi:hypothetical protein